MSEDRERPKKSWREIDKAKDQSAHRREEPRRETPRAKTAQKQYRATLDRLFDQGEAERLLKGSRSTSSKKKGEKDDSRFARIRAVREAIGRDEISLAVDRLLEMGPLPLEEEVLTQAIDHRDEEKVQMALSALLQWLERNRPRRQGTLKARLSGLASNDALGEETIDLAKKVLEKL